MAETSDRAGPVLVAERLAKRYGSLHALRDVSFTLAAGELLAVIGPNGAGKTTLLSILAGVTRADDGSLRLQGGKIGWVPQQAAVYGKLTVAENLRLFARLEGAEDPEGAVERMLEQTALRERAGDEVGTLSGGNRQRVNTAAGLLGEPAVLALDEPSASLDPRQRERLWGFLERLSETGTAVVYSTHNVQEAERYADRVLVLDEGELRFDGTPRELGEAAQLSHADFEGAFVRFLDSRAREAATG